MKENQEKVGYYSVIPATVLYNKELKANEKLLYAIITSLACKEGYCFASNKYLAEKLDVNPKTISSWISDLKNKNFIVVELIRNENNQIIQRKIYINDVPYEETYLPDGVYMNSFGPYKVPENAYFVMGDNRTISNDARSWTYKDVTSDEIVARAWFKYYPHWEVF